MADSLKNGSKVAIDFNATWCGPCKQIAPLFAQLSQKYPNVTFLSVDVDKCKATAAALNIASIPTFNYCIGETLVMSQVGASKEKLQESVKLLSEKNKEELLKHVVEKGDVVEGEQEKAGEHDLGDAVDLSRSECLNDLPDHPFAAIFKADDSYVQSDTDEQLLFTIAFRKISAVKTLKFVGLVDGSGPKTVKLYLNRQNMGFSDTEELKPLQQFVLTAADLKADTPPLALDYARFVKTDTLTVFIQDNQGGKEATKLTRLIIWGKKSA